MNIQWNPLPYFSRRWGKTSFIVVHWSGGYTLQDAFETLKQRKLSYHYMVDGNTIWSLVDEKNIAYHAGNWIANTKSVGVCHVGIWEQPIKEDSYATSGQLLAEICRRNGFEPNDKTIVPHSQLKATACPGSLDIHRLIGEARKFYLGQVPEVIPQPSPQPVDNFPRQVTATEKLRVRKDSNTGAEIMGFKEKDEVFTVIGETDGEIIQGNSKWLNTASKNEQGEWFGTGYVSAFYTK